jgi:hypothetical protein
MATFLVHSLPLKVLKLNCRLEHLPLAISQPHIELSQLCHEITSMYACTSFAVFSQSQVHPHIIQWFLAWSFLH